MRTKAKLAVALALVAFVMPVGQAENQSPFVKKAGDSMTGNLGMGGNAVVFNGGALTTNGGTLTFGGQAVCVQNAPCGQAPPPMVGTRLSATNGPNYVNFLGDDVCTQHEMLLPVQAQGPGLILVSGTVTVEFEHFQGIQDWGRLRVATLEQACTGIGLFDSVFSLNAEHGNGYYQQTVPVSAFLYVRNPGTYTWSVFGAMEQGFSPGAGECCPPDRLLWANLHAIWAPE